MLMLKKILKYQFAVQLNNRVSSQQRIMSDDIKTDKGGIRNLYESWSFVPGDDTRSRTDNPDVYLSVPAIITRHGYRCETHTVISQGYALNIHRIPHSKDSTVTPPKAILLQHGLLQTSADWILNGPEKALAYVLADAGYDVWMTNIRGNKYSKEHTWLKKNSKAYWNFSWHDVALHDIPAVIDYILKLKGAGTKIGYIGHSMGTTILFAMLTLRPEYNDILSIGVALAPEVFLTEIKSPLKGLAPMVSNIAYMEMLYGVYEFIPKKSILGKISGTCQTDNADAEIKKNIIFYISGYDEDQFNKELLPVFLSHSGTGTSWKTVLHFAQEVLAGGKFQQFDYGSRHNKQVYGSKTPPEYDLKKVTLPIVLFGAHNDLLSSMKDVCLLHENLPPATTQTCIIPHLEFNHVDYLWAVDARELYVNTVLEKLRIMDL